MLVRGRVPPSLLKDINREVKLTTQYCKRINEKGPQSVLSAYLKEEQEASVRRSVLPEIMARYTEQDVARANSIQRGCVRQSLS